jgi:cytochrome P450
MTISTGSDVYFDPYNVDINADPYPVFARLREEAPLYYNSEHDFFALSRYEDVNKGIVNHGLFSSAKGAILELIRADFPIPSGVLIFEDPPVHDIHRKLLARMFTPRKIALLEDKIREYCAQSLDAVAGTGTFDFVADLGAIMPMKTISALIGIPEQDQQAVRDHVTEQMKTEAGQPMKAAEEGLVSGDIFADYIDWRVDNPSDDIMTELLNVEFVDETGTTRRLTRDELLIYLNVVAGAGNDTTTRLIGWAGKVLGEHPDQRRQLVEDPSLIPKAIEELVRFEPPATSSITARPCRRAPS